MNEDELVGERFGGYDVLREIGSGGMGVVYEARKADTGLVVALKILASDLAEDEESLLRFQREGMIASRINHPNVVKIYEVGKTEGLNFIAMEFIDGRELERMIREKGRLEPAQALDIGAQVASALTAAHELHILHRDIKPQNIMVDASGRAKILDFGIVKAMKGMVGLTMQGVTLGTLEYMSPEQCEGRELDPRSDIWALGIVLYQALTGRVPFPGGNAIVVMRQIVHEPVTPLDELRPGLPKAVSAAIEKALAKKRDHRYASASEFEAELRRVLRMIEEGRDDDAPTLFAAPVEDDDDYDDEPSDPEATSMLPLSVARPTPPPMPPPKKPEPERKPSPPPPPPPPPKREEPKPPEIKRPESNKPEPKKPEPKKPEPPKKGEREREADSSKSAPKWNPPGWGKSPEEERAQREIESRARTRKVIVLFFLIVAVIGAAAVAAYFARDLIGDSLGSFGERDRGSGGGGGGSSLPPPVTVVPVASPRATDSPGPTPRPTSSPAPSPTVRPGSSRLGWVSAPEPDSRVKASPVRLAWRVEEGAEPKSYLYSVNKPEPTTKLAKPELDLKLDQPGRQTVVIVGVGANGKKGEPLRLTFDYLPNRKPAVMAQLEPARLQLGQESVLTAMATDSDGGELKIEARYPGGEWMPLPPKGLPFRAPTAGSYTLEVRATDPDGLSSDPAFATMEVLP